MVGTLVVVEFRPLAPMMIEICRCYPSCSQLAHCETRSTFTMLLRSQHCGDSSRQLHAWLTLTPSKEVEWLCCNKMRIPSLRKLARSVETEGLRDWRSLDNWSLATLLFGDCGLSEGAYSPGGGSSGGALVGASLPVLFFIFFKR